MIPKIIHYIWFGNTQNNITKKSINTWKKRAPEYEIIEWNERNLPDYENEFYQKALSNKDYAFASDYARLRILQQYGGIYMDTDMYLLKDPHKILTNKDLVFGIQDQDMIFSTSFIASSPNQEFINRALSVYDQLKYKKGKLRANTELLSPLMYSMYGFKHETETQIKGTVAAYSPKILLQPSFQAVAMHIGAKVWAPHNKHDRFRIELRQHISNRLTAGIFSIANNIARKIL